MTQLNAALRALRGEDTMTAAGFRALGHWEVQVNDGPWEIDPNIVVDEGIMHFLTTTLAQGSQNTAFYVAVYGGAVTPPASWTAANFPASSTEFTNYTEVNRVLWAKDAAAAKAIGNNTTPAVFTIGVGGGTVRGAALVSVAAKSAVTGVLIAATRFATDKVLDAGSELRIKYVLAGSST